MKQSKVLATVIITTLLMMSCTNRYISNLDEMTASIEQVYRDRALNGNMSEEEFIISPIGYDTISARYIDSVEIVRNTEKINFYLKLIESSSERVNSLSESNEEYKRLGYYDYVDTVQINEYLEDIRIVTYSVTCLRARNVLMRANLVNMPDTAYIYRYKAVIKGKLRHNKAQKFTVNINDTVTYYFDKELRRLLDA
ncbi:MAG: hypothetical protein QM660_08995 [Dysgonomonas sp.]